MSYVQVEGREHGAVMAAAAGSRKLVSGGVVQHLPDKDGTGQHGRIPKDRAWLI